MNTKYTVKYTNIFKKDYKLAIKQGRNIALLQEIITRLAKGEILPEKYKDHELIGNWLGHRECHVQSDWLLIYKINEDEIILTLARVGTHSQLLQK